MARIWLWLSYIYRNLAVTVLYGQNLAVTVLYVTHLDPLGTTLGAISKPNQAYLLGRPVQGCLAHTKQSPT